MRQRALRGCLIAIALLSASQAIPQPNNPRKAGQKTEHSKREWDQRNTATSSAPLSPFPIWTLQQLPPQIIYQVTEQQPKESAHCTKNNDWSDVFSFYLCSIWFYITPEQTTAIFTVILSISTIGLWVATIGLWVYAAKSAVAARKAANAAKLQAVAAINTELPIIFVKNIEFSAVEFGDHIYDGSLPRAPEIDVTFFNYGRTPAELIGFYISTAISRKLPESRPEHVIYDAIHGAVIEKESNSKPFPFVFDWTDDERRQIEAGNTRLWAYGLIKYRDFMSSEHELGFCKMAVLSEPGKLVFVGSTETPPGYIYNKQYDKPAPFVSVSGCKVVGEAVGKAGRFHDIL